VPQGPEDLLCAFFCDDLVIFMFCLCDCSHFLFNRGSAKLWD
jgi:hypothetical protein